MRNVKPFPHLIIFSLFLFLGLFLVPFQLSAANNDMLPEVREILKTYYVDEVADDVLQAKTISDMLSKLGDVNTEYFTSEEYKQFTGSLNRSFAGVGIELYMVPQGVQVTNVYKGYGADLAGILAGDIIIAGGGDSFAGKSAEYCTSRLKGPAGTKVQVKVQRGDRVLDFTLQRMLIVLPTVEGRLVEGDIGYIIVHSFGEDTAAKFGEQLKALRHKGAECWIIDLRNNGGGYTQAALDLLGYFIKDKTAVIVEDRYPPALAYRATKQDSVVTGPVILLTNEYTASSSEITAAALKDYGKAVILGEKTYGSGLVKALMPLSNGDYFKLPVQRFFSPQHRAINQVGVVPDVRIKGCDELETAVLLLKHSNLDLAADGNKTGYLRLNAGPGKFTLSLADLRRPDYWQLGQKILDTARVNTTLDLGGVGGWEPLPKKYLQDRSKIYYPEYIEAGRLNNIPRDKIFKVTFSHAMNWDSVSADSIELINTTSGERVECECYFVDSRVMQVMPRERLQANTEYWLVIHPELQDRAGRNISGGLAIAWTGAK